MKEINQEFGIYQKIVNKAMERDSANGPIIEKVVKKFFKDQKEQENIYNCLKQKIEEIIEKIKAKSPIDNEDKSYIQTVIAINEQAAAKRALNKPETIIEMDLKFHDLAQEIKNHNLF